MDLFGIKRREDARLLRQWQDMMRLYRERRGHENPDANPWLIRYPFGSDVQRNYERFLAGFDRKTGEPR